MAAKKRSNSKGKTRAPLRVALSNRTVDSGLQRCRYDYDRHRVELSVTVSFDGKALFVNCDHPTPANAANTKHVLTILFAEDY